MALKTKIIIAVLSVSIAASAIGAGVYYGTHKKDVETVENTSVLTTQANDWVEDYDFASSDENDELNSYKKHTLPPVTLN